MKRRVGGVALLCLALPWFAWGGAGWARWESRKKGAGGKKISKDFAEERKTNPQPHWKSSREGRVAWTRLQGEGKGKTGKGMETWTRLRWERKAIVNQLQEHLSNLHESVAAAVQEELTEMCKEGRKGAEKQGKVDQRENWRASLSRRTTHSGCSVEVVKERFAAKELTRTTKLTLLKNQKYSLDERGSF